MNIFLAVLVIFISLRVTTSKHINQENYKSVRSYNYNDQSNKVARNTNVDLFCDVVSLSCQTPDVAKSLSNLNFFSALNGKNTKEVVRSAATELKAIFYKELIWKYLFDSETMNNNEFDSDSERELRTKASDIDLRKCNERNKMHATNCDMSIVRMMENELSTVSRFCEIAKNNEQLLAYLRTNRPRYEQMK